MKTGLLTVGVAMLLLTGVVYALAGTVPDTLRVSQFAGPVGLTGHATLRSTAPGATFGKAKTAPARLLQPGLITDAQYAYWLHLFLLNDTES